MRSSSSGGTPDAASATGPTSAPFCSRECSGSFAGLRSAQAHPADSPPTRRDTINAVVNRMTAPQIRSLIAISENESFDAAARSLRIAQPSCIVPPGNLSAISGERSTSAPHTA